MWGNQMKKIFTSSFIASFMSLSLLFSVNAKENEQILPNKISFGKGFVTYINLEEGFKSALIGDTKIAEVVVPPKQNKTVLIFSKTLGDTNLLLTSTKDVKSEIAISINKDSSIKDSIAINLKKGKAHELSIEKGIDRVIVADPMIANVIVKPKQNKEMSLIPNNKGVTNLLVWSNKSDKPLNYMIKVE